MNQLLPLSAWVWVPFKTKSGFININDKWKTGTVGYVLLKGGENTFFIGKIEERNFGMFYITIEDHCLSLIQDHSCLAY